jgi:hypothetical protein
MALTKKTRLKHGEKIILKLTLKQADLVSELPCLTDELLDILHHSKVMDGIVSMGCTLDLLDELSGHVAAEANHTKDKKLEKKLDALLAAIEKLSGSYYEDDEPPAEIKRPHLFLVKPAPEAPPAKDASFSPKAAAFWAKVPDDVKPKLLDNVYCGHCRGGVTITRFSGTVKSGDLLLQGSCAICGHEVARLVEGS